MAQKKEDASLEKHVFKIRYFLYALPLALLLLAVFSHSSADLAVLEGGSNAPLQNLIGYAGAHIARSIFYLIGLAAYPMTAILTLSLIRGFIPYPLKRRFYIISLLAAALGFALLFAVTPADYNVTTGELGTGRFDSAVEDLALSGGVIGAFFAAPAALVNGTLREEGVLRVFIGVTGTIITAWALLIT